MSYQFRFWTTILMARAYHLRLLSFLFLNLQLGLERVLDHLKNVQCCQMMKRILEFYIQTYWGKFSKFFHLRFVPDDQGYLGYFSFSYILSKSKLEPGWTAPANLEKELGTNMKHYKIHQDFFPAQVPKLDRNASRLDMSIASSISLPCKFLESLERQARNVISINSYADLFATAAFSSLSSEEMDANVLRRLIESLVNCIKHSTNVSVLMAMALFSR